LKGKQFGMLNRVITVDFDKKCGKIKPVNSINGGPRSGGYDLPYDMSEEFSEMNIPFVRTSTPKGEYGLNQFINVHCIFPDFDADPDSEDSYNFLPTDLYITSVKNTGADIFFRLGESREPYGNKIFTKPPKDPEKWASVCEHIIMHYNEGWANGYKFNVKNWEIWNSPDSQEGFSGEPKEFFELYRITANRLRERFPKIKIGAYGQSGFYALNRLDATEEAKNYVPFMQDFFRYVTAEGTSAPLDFFTWSCYTSNPDELAMHIKYARTYLDSAGLKKTKSIITEYNTVNKSGVPSAKRADFPSELCASLILAQKNAVDMMFYSTSDVNNRENGLFSVDDFDTHRHYGAYSVMTSFGRLCRLGNVAETTGDYRKEVYSLAAFDEREAALLLVTSNYTGRVEIILKGSEFKTCSVLKIVGGGERGEGTVYKAENIAITGGRILVPAKKNEVFLVTFFDKPEPADTECDPADIPI
jgi:hypothetical protein